MVTLDELLELRDRYRQHPELLDGLPSYYLPLIEEQIETKRKRIEEEEKDDPALEARIQAWIAEGRIYEGSIMDFMGGDNNGEKDL